MCNKVHKTKKDTIARGLVDYEKGWEPRFKTIKSEGFGWKIFRTIVNERHDVLGPAYGGMYYTDCTNFSILDPSLAWIKWTKEACYIKQNTKNRGFCFFGTRQAALNVCSRAGQRVRKIAYKKGLGSFVSPELNGTPVRFRLAKEFKVID